MPTTSWGRGRTALFIGAEGGALDGMASALTAVGFQVRVAPPSVDVLAVLREGPVAVVYVDAAVLGPALDVVRALKRAHPEVPCILARAAPSVFDVADAMRAGAFDFLPADVAPTTVVARLHDALEAPPPLAPVEVSSTRPDGIVGGAPSMRRLFSLVERVSRFKTNVLLLGESGAGKELVARALHDASARRDAPFVPVNCATLGKELLENELFGHERGAFTGAHAQKLGLFELADGGTLFLDEIGEMDPTTQAKLLRVLERSAFRRVGGTAKVKVDTVVIAATNRDLRVAIAAGRFREDLYYRLKVATIVVPPLRERAEDIPALVASFIAAFNARHGTRILGVSPEAMDRLMAYSWPGNVRELKHLVENAAMIAEEPLLAAALFDDVMPATARSTRLASERLDGVSDEEELRIRLPATLSDVERLLILSTLRRTPTRREAALQLGIGLRTLYAKLRQLEDP